MARPKRRLLVFDGHAILHRAWHALPPLTTKDGTVVSGAYGFTSTFLKAVREFAPDYVVVTFDLKGPTFRHEEYAEYKATREEKPDELYAQIPIIERILERMGVRVVTAEGFEADDVIGTVTRVANASDKELESVIVTGDLDTLQLVDKRTKVYTMRKGMSDTVLYDESAVKERYGLRPDQMIDYKALRGDPSDNIPGVRGIGEKTATELIGTFGSLAKLYAAIEKDDKRAEGIRASVKEKLVAHKKDALQAEGLVTIRRDVPVGFVLEDASYAPATQDDMATLFEELQFMRLLTQLPKRPVKKEATISLFDAAKEKKEKASVPNVSTLERPSEAERALSALEGGAIAFRTLVEKDDPLTPELIAFGIADADRAYIIPAAAFPKVSAAVSALFERFEGTVVCHDLKRETNVLHALGIALPVRPFDLMIASYLLHSGERRHSLDAMLSLYRSIPAPDKKAGREERVERLGTELAHFVALSGELGEGLKKEDLTGLNEDVELPLAGVLARMERAGIAIDAKHFSALSKTLAKKAVALTKRIHALAGGEFNINSPAQLKEVLFERLGISPQGLKKTQKGGGLSTAAAELEKLRGEHEIIGKILEYREVAKLRSTYVDALPPLAHPKDGRIHASFNQTVTATGRLSSSDPNLQNIPTAETEYGREVRNGFIAPKGKVLIAADYSQIELRLAAHIAKEKVMIEAFRNGEDIHWRTAAAMFGEEHAKEKRRIAKVINFGILYGMGPTRLAESAGVSFAEAREYIDRYFAIHTGIAGYIEDMKEKVRKDGFVETLFGRKRYFHNFDLMNQREQAEAERQAMNMPFQGTQADLIKVAMVRLDAHLRNAYGEADDRPARIVVQVHDELVVECDAGISDGVRDAIVPIMENVLKLDVPIVVNVSSGRRWGEMKGE